MSDAWDDRKKSLEEEYFRRQEQEAIEKLRTFLAERMAKWWVPERWAFIEEAPKTSVGKFDKKQLRARRENGELEITPN